MTQATSRRTFFKQSGTAVLGASAAGFAPAHDVLSALRIVDEEPHGGDDEVAQGDDGDTDDHPLDSEEPSDDPKEPPASGPGDDEKDGDKDDGKDDPLDDGKDDPGDGEKPAQLVCCILEFYLGQNHSLLLRCNTGLGLGDLDGRQSADLYLLPVELQQILRAPQRLLCDVQLRVARQQIPVRSFRSFDSQLGLATEFLSAGL